jgi:hypothetical protein
VPAIVAGLKEGLDAATYSNYELAMRRFADLTMRPNWRSACARAGEAGRGPGRRAPVVRRLGDRGAAAGREGSGRHDGGPRHRRGISLINAGYTPDSVKAALAASDVTLLDHTGLVSVQLQKPNSQLKELTAPKPADVSVSPDAKPSNADIKPSQGGQP